DGLAALERRFPTPSEPAWLTTAVPTIVSGGTAHNRLPEKIVLTLDVRYIPEERPDEIIAALQECFPGSEVGLAQRPFPPLATDPDDAGVRRLAECVAAVTGQP